MGTQEVSGASPLATGLSSAAPIEPASSFRPEASIPSAKTLDDSLKLDFWHGTLAKSVDRIANDETDPVRQSVLLQARSRLIWARDEMDRRRAKALDEFDTKVLSAISWCIEQAEYIMATTASSEVDSSGVLQYVNSMASDIAINLQKAKETLANTQAETPSDTLGEKAL